MGHGVCLQLKSFVNKSFDIWTFSGIFGAPLHTPHRSTCPLSHSESHLLATLGGCWVLGVPRAGAGAGATTMPEIGEGDKSMALTLAFSRDLCRAKAEHCWPTSEISVRKIFPSRESSDFSRGQLSIRQPSRPGHDDQKRNHGQRQNGKTGLRMGLIAWGTDNFLHLINILEITQL